MPKYTLQPTTIDTQEFGDWIYVKVTPPDKAAYDYVVPRSIWDKYIGKGVDWIDKQNYCDEISKVKVPKFLAPTEKYWKHYNERPDIQPDYKNLYRSVLSALKAKKFDSLVYDNSRYDGYFYKWKGDKLVPIRHPISLYFPWRDYGDYYYACDTLPKQLAKHPDVVREPDKLHCGECGMWILVMPSHKEFLEHTKPGRDLFGTERKIKDRIVKDLGLKEIKRNEED